VSQYSAYSAGSKRCAGNKLEQVEETKGKCSGRGPGTVLPLPPALALRAAAVLLHLADASFCPAGQKERCWEAMDS